MSRGKRGPSNSEGLALFERLLANDPVAPSDLAVTYLDRLTDWLTQHNPSLPEDMRATAAEDALLALIKNPQSYKPERQSLEVYLRMSASGDLKNLLRSERRHSDRRARLEAVEHSSVVGKYLQDPTGDPEHILDRQMAEGEFTGAQRPIPASFCDGLAPKESKVLDLMLEKERKTAAYAVALGIEHFPFVDQQRAVKKVKDKLKKRLARAGCHDG